MAAFRLPVSGVEVLLRPPAGAEDLLLAEEAILDGAAGGSLPPNPRLALALVGALGRLADGGAVPWASLPVVDLDAALLALRRIAIGDLVRSSLVCAARACGARVDIAFRIGDYLAHHAPKRPRGVSAVHGGGHPRTPGAEPGWLRIEGVEATFRVPSCADLLAIDGRADAEAELARRCLRPEVVPPRVRRRIEAALSALAPSLSGELEGRCPECSATVRTAFDPQRYVLTELRARAVFVYEEVHLIAGHYRWSEGEILAMPRARRARYAELVHEARLGA